MEHPQTIGFNASPDHARTLEAWKVMERAGTIRRDLLREHVFRDAFADTRDTSRRLLRGVLDAFRTASHGETLTTHVEADAVSASVVLQSAGRRFVLLSLSRAN